jgi:hypothetical protein
LANPSPLPRRPCSFQKNELARVIDVLEKKRITDYRIKAGSLTLHVGKAATEEALDINAEGNPWLEGLKKDDDEAA